MIMKNLNYKTIGLFGFGIENQALLKYLLKKKIFARFVVCDNRDKSALAERMRKFSRCKNIVWIFGGASGKDFPKFDIVFRSPGWPLFDKLIKKARLSGADISSPMQLFCDLCPTKNLIGVSGTKGKGTTSSLIAAMLKTAGKKTYLGGNIGVAPFSFLDKLKIGDFVVLELSSFQLEDLQATFRAAVFTNFSREHLLPADPNNPNCHGTMAKYLDAKLNLFRFQKNSGAAFVNRRMKKKFEGKALKGSVPAGNLFFFGKSDLPSRLIGEHNRENIAAASAVVEFFKISQKAIAAAVKKFAGLEHRLEFVCERQGVRYYNDSFATMPDATITALKSFSEPIILIAGGAHKGSDFSALAREMKKRAKCAIIFSGQALPHILRALKQASFPKENIFQTDSMQDALLKARKATAKGDVVLLSPACASFGIFNNYKERGEMFKTFSSKIHL